MWLDDRSDAKKIEAARALAELPDVIATYTRTGERYVERPWT